MKLIVALVVCPLLTGLLCQALASHSFSHTFLDSDVSEQSFISSAYLAVGQEPDPQLPDLFHASIADLSAGLWQGNFSSVDLTRAYLARISSTRKLNAILTISPYALVEAADADIELARLKAKCGDTAQDQCPFSIPPLLGIPYLAKDNIAVPAHVGPTTAGSFSFLNTTVRRPSAIVQQLAHVGAVLIGTTNMDEFAQAKGIAPWGYSSRGGQMDSPYFSGGDICGSSGGSAIAVSLGLSAFALGTQTGGSIVCPSSKLGIVGLKPSPWVLNMEGIIPISHHFDAVGPITRTVSDAALVFHILKDNKIYPSLETRFPHPWKIGVPLEGFWSVSNIPEPLYHDISRCRNKLVEALKAENVEVQYAELPNLRSLRNDGHRAFSIIGMHDLAVDMSSYLSGLERDGGLHTLSDIISWHRSHPSIALPSGPKAPNGHPLRNPSWRYSDQSMLEYSASIDVAGDRNASYRSALKDVVRIAWDENLEPYFNRNKLDFILVPSESFASEVAAMAGLPMLTIPLGFTSSVELGEGAGWPYYPYPGMPFGVSLISRKGQEDLLLLLGKKVERIVQEREGQDGRWKRIRTDVKRWLQDAEHIY